MKPFNIFFETKEEFSDICNYLTSFGYCAPYYTNKDKCFIMLSEDMAVIRRGNILLDSHVFYWKNQKEETIKFLRQNSDSIKLSNELNERHDAECMRNMFGNESKTSQLEQRIRELEIKQITDLDDVNKRMRSIDKKLRYRILMLEGDVHPYSSKARERGEAIRNVSSMIKEELQKTKGQDMVATFGRRDEEFHETIKSFGIHKIAISVENEQEYMELVQIFKSKGWTSWRYMNYNVLDMFHMKGHKVYFTFKDKYQTIDNEELAGHLILSFQTLKAILS